MESVVAVFDIVGIDFVSNREDGPDLDLSAHRIGEVAKHARHLLDGFILVAVAFLNRGIRDVLR